MVFLKESLQTASCIKQESFEGVEKMNLEGLGLKEIVSSVNFLGVKRGGRESGVHKWGR